MSGTKELERNNLRNAFFNSNEIMEQRVESFKYSVKIESSYFAAGTKVELFLTINLLFNCECLDVGSPVQMLAFKISIDCFCYFLL